MADQIIIFEELFHVHRWIIRWYLLRKKQVCFLRLNTSAKQKKWVNDLYACGKLKKLDLNFLAWGLWETMHFDEAFNQLDKVFPEIRRKKIIEAMKELYQTETIELAYKMAVHAKMSRFCYLVFALNKLQHKFPKNKIEFIPSTGYDFARSSGCEINEFNVFLKMFKKAGEPLLDEEGPFFAPWAIFVSQCCYAAQKVKGFILLSVFPFVILGKVLINFWKKADPALKNHYTYAFQVFSVPHRQDNRVPRFDFLIDRDQVKEEESVFVSYNKVVGKIREYLQLRDIPFIDDPNGFINFKGFRRAIPAYMCLIKTFLRDEYFIFLSSLRLIYCYLRWSGFSEKILVDNLISNCDFGMESVARNLILGKNGTKTYYYMESSNCGCFYAKNNNKTIYRGGIAYAYYDYFISWGDMASKYYRESKCEFKKYVNVGCLWSKLDNLEVEGKEASNVKSVLSQHKFQDGMKLISVFDSTLSDDCISGYDEGIKFLEGIVRLLNDYPDIFVILKEKKTRSHHQRITDKGTAINALYSALDSHPRALCTSQMFDSSQMISASDLSISFPFTSPTLEAVAGRKRAVWYDAQGKYRGTYYDQIPGLVCHDYEELSSRVNQLLYSVSEKDYDEYLNNEIHGKVESYLDGKAITRFKQCLGRSENIEKPEFLNVSLRELQSSK